MSQYYKSQIIKIRVIPNAKKNEIVKEKDRLKVYLTAPPIEGKANKVLIEILAEYFNVKKGQIKIIKGEKSKDKIIEIINTSL
ncbi:MAG: DUF167 domain-containing protein [candidate division WOR-3 bacterium]